MKAKTVLLIALGLIVLAAIIQFQVIPGIRSAPFQPYVEGYLNVPGFSEDLADRNGHDAYLRGKVIIVNVRQKVDSLHFKLTPELQASSPNEVVTVVWLHCWDRIEGFYQDDNGYRHGPGTSNRCDLKIIDRSIPAVIAQKSFSGTAPPGVLYGSNSAAGTDPSGEVIGWLEKLPRKVSQP